MMKRSDAALMAVARGMVVLGLGGLVFVAGWYLLSRLSSDAVGLLLGALVGGALFGVGALSIRTSARPVPELPALREPTYVMLQLPDGTRALLSSGGTAEAGRALPVQRPALTGDD